MPPEQQSFIPPVTPLPPITPPPTPPVEPSAAPSKNRLFLRISVFILFVLIAFAAVGAFYIQKEEQEQLQIAAKLETTGSAEYKSYIGAIDKLEKEWAVMEAEMRTGSSTEGEIQLAKKDFLNYFAQTYLLMIQLGETKLTDEEKKGVILRLSQLVIDNPELIEEDKICRYKEDQLPLQDIFVGAKIKFKKPMVYVENNEEDECSQNMVEAPYELWPAESWEPFERSVAGQKYQVDPSTTFTVEKRFLLKDKGLFGEDSEYYFLRNDKGQVSVSATHIIFDQDYSWLKTSSIEGRAGSELYKDGKYIGKLVSDLTTGSVWIQGTPIPQEVIEANTPKKPAHFDDFISKKTEFMERIGQAIGDGKIIKFTNQEVITNDLGKDLYTYKNGDVINDFGGKISLKKSGDTVLVTFEKIPSGDTCYRFYFINDPDLYGFSESYIDGVLEAYPGKDYASIEVDNFKKQVCGSEKDTVTIEFRGTLNKIKEQAKFIKGFNTPRY